MKKEAREEGLQEGREEGREEGKKEGIQKIAIRMLQEDIDINMIIKVTGIKKEEIEKL